jgi:predicted small lipoprotein YifL
MDKPIVRIASRLAPVAAVLLLAACGNKGPLVRAPETAPPVVPMAADAPEAPAGELEGTLPDTTPPEQPAAPDVVAPPPADDIDETQPPPETGDDPR